MVAALGMLVVDFVGTHMYEQKHRSDEEHAATANGSSREEIAAALLEDGALAARGDVDGRDGGGHKEDAMHIVGMRTHAGV